MAREKMFDPQFLKSFAEAIHRENRIRMKWHVEYGNRVARDSVVEWDGDSDVEDEVEEGPCPEKPTKLVVEREEEEPRKPREVEPKRADKTPKGGSKTKEGKSSKEKDVVPWPSTSASGTTGVTRVADTPPIMKPVDAKTKVLLYQGLSHDGEGRAQYLKSRTQRDPEAKYTFPICSSWEYGWKYGMVQDELTAPDHGRVNIIHQSFFRPNDPQIKPREDNYYQT